MRASTLKRSALISTLGAAALIGSALAAPGLAMTAVAATANTVNVTVNTQEGYGTIPSTAYGLNTAVWDSLMNTTQTQQLLKQANVEMLRYPGGSYGDQFDWQTTTVQGGYVAPGTNFDQFMGTAKTIGAQPILIANYGTGTPQQAAGWVQYANVTKGYGVKYWEIGNEQYGDGVYGANWEANNYTDKSAAKYAAELLQYSSAMKAVDPTIKIGAVLTLPGNWPDSVVASGQSGDWNQQVLSAIGSSADFVIVHYYPASSLGASVVDAPEQLGGELTQLRQEIDQYAGANGPNIQIAMTETDGNTMMDTQPGALFAEDTYLTALEHGVFTVDYWDLHNSATGIATAPDGATDYGDEGVLSNASCVGTTCEPAANTPFPTYFAIQMLGKLGMPGDTMVTAGTDQQPVVAHAVRNANGNLSVMLINKDPSNSYQVNLHYTGFFPSAATPTVYTYGAEAASITSAAQGSSASQTLPPYSVETIVLQPQSGSESALTAPGAPSVSNVTATQATVSWTPSGGGQVDKYNVYRQLGTISELLGTSTTGSFTVYNLNPGTEYTFNVVAVDQKGYQSLPSAPVWFITGTPSQSTCAVTYNLSNGWGSGFVANLTVTNTGPSAINGWTLAFTFPSNTESVTSNNWNGNWTWNGTSVQVTNVNWNGYLAPSSGNTVSLGFVSTQNGAYPSPASFTLNGTVCATTYSS
ncbi:MAG TPA: cellulose binding domain-containing protein [Actinocrinis sp.]|uniref:cellulose binding domain-containing protein n=1 Tax=Actinocrinis sp. TaxID=1920516 RepID=UPI002DDDB6BE|nr:cellulose binding domain-containing protein [Actinocrinis sp.]HEV2343417.1 cellulose binding domain-containing protein [Actinocrinis sp.]